jgi:hypothetical protein
LGAAQLRFIGVKPCGGQGPTARHAKLRVGFGAGSRTNRDRVDAAALMSDLPRHNGWTIAEHAGDRAPDRTQRLLNRAAWDSAGAMAVVRRFAVAGPGQAARGRRGPVVGAGLRRPEMRSVDLCPAGEGNSLQRGVDAQLSHQVLHVAADRIGGQVHILGDLTSADALD